MKLYGFFRSSAAYRVRIALNLKKLPYAQSSVHLSRDGGWQWSEEYRAINPQKRRRTSQRLGFDLTDERSARDAKGRSEDEPGFAVPRASPSRDAGRGEIGDDRFREQAAGVSTSVGEFPNAGMVPVTTGYFETLRIPLVKGRYFNRSDTPDSLPVAIVNSSVARKYWLNQDPGSKVVQTGEPAFPHAGA